VPRKLETVGRHLHPGRRVRLATSRFRILPSFLIIGAQRAGTTSLIDYLGRHPDVAAPSPGGHYAYPGELVSWRGSWLEKELHFFDSRFELGLDWYRSFFPLRARRRVARARGRDLIAGEATPYYLFHPGVPERVAATLPDVRLIVLVRNPVDRAYSHFHLMKRKGLEKLSFAKAVAAEERRLAGVEERLREEPAFRSKAHRHHSYLARGLYAEQLERWFAVFPRERFLILRAEDFFADTAEVYSDVLDFLELRQWRLRRTRHRNKAEYKPLKPELRAQLEEHFAEPNARLERLLERDFGWPPKAQPAELARSQH
jgi:hypothetical protein